VSLEEGKGNYHNHKIEGLEPRTIYFKFKVKLFRRNESEKLRILENAQFFFFISTDVR